MSKKPKPTNVEPVVLETLALKQVFKDILKRYGEDSKITVQAANTVDFLCSEGGERTQDDDPYKE